MLILGVVGIVAGVGVFFFRRWGRNLYLAICGLTFAVWIAMAVITQPPDFPEISVRDFVVTNIASLPAVLIPGLLLFSPVRRSFQ